MKNKIKFLFLLLFLLSILSFNALSQVPSIGVIKVIVSPDHRDWAYKLNENAKFSVQVLKFGNTIENVTVDYAAGPESMPVIMKKGVVLKDGRMEFTGTMTTPGFYRLTVWANVEGKRYEGMATAAFEPDKLQPLTIEPADFDSFWQNAIAQARKVDLQPTMTLVPERCTSDANVYHINFQNDKPGSRIYGMLAVPKKPGKYPALLKVPGGGVYKYGGDARMAALGIVTLEIGIHGIPVNLDPQFYADLSNGALFNYYNIRANDPDENYFKRVFLGCIKAVDFIFQLPEFNGIDLAVTGQSQGGLLSIVTAGLDKRINYLAPIYPGGCDNLRFLLTVTGDKVPLQNSKAAEAISYYDCVNFARRITIPGYYSWGYNDVVCHPTSMCATYNIITAPKELHIFQETGHWTYPEEQENVNKWLVKQIKKTIK